MCAHLASPPDVRERVPLAPLTTLELGGRARHLAEVRDLGEAVEALRWGRRSRLEVTVLGGGSNVVVADRGVDGLVLRVAFRGFEIERRGSTRVVTVGAGEPWDEVVERTVDAGLAGLECLSGIPGTAGATPIQNVGAYGQEVAETLDWVEVLDRRSLRVERLAAAACGFSYRSSRFRRRPGRHLVLGLGFALRRGGAATVRYPELETALGGGRHHPTVADVRRAVLELRRAKSMLIEPDDPNRRSVGSFFLNPVLSVRRAKEVSRRAADLGDGDPPGFAAPGGGVKLSAAWLISHSGFERGTRRGAVGVSSRHSLALVHHGGGRTLELVALARDIRAAVRDRYGIDLQPEPTFVGFSEADPTA